MLDKMKQLMEMQRKMQELKKELENTVFEVTGPDGQVKIVMNAAQEIKEVVLQEGLSLADKLRLEKAIKDAYNTAIKQAQKLAAQKMQGLGGIP